MNAGASRNTAMKVAAIFVNYRTAQLTFEAVCALTEKLGFLEAFSVWVVDNDSQDGSFETLTALVGASKFVDKVFVLAAPKNGGYGYGINFGTQAIFAAGHRPEYIYVLNTDAFADPGSLQEQIAFMDEHPQVGMAGNRIRNFGNTTQGCGFRFPTVLGELEESAKWGLISALLRHRTITILPPPTENTRVDWVPGTSMLVRAEVFHRGVWFDEKFFLYFEEIDFAQQIYGAGWEIYTIPNASIAHHGSVSTGLDDTKKPWPPYWYDSRRRYFNKYHDPRYALACDAARAAGTGVYWVKCLLKRVPYDERPGTIAGMLGARIRAVAPKNLSARDIPGWVLLLEDWQTHNWDLCDSALWGLVLHRMRSRANAGSSDDERSPFLSVIESIFDWFFKTRLDPSTRIGRRVKLGGRGILVEADEIGDDVQLGANVTLIPVEPGNTSPHARPRLGPGVRLHSGVAVVGGVTLAPGVVVCQNSVVARDVLESAELIGIPAGPAKPGLSAVGAEESRSIRESESSPQASPLSLWSTLKEDLRAYEYDFQEPGVWITALHRLAFQNGASRPGLLRRALFGPPARILGAVVGIEIAPETRLGRRVRIWHAGGIALQAKRIGDDVYLRPNTSCEPSPGGGIDAWPTIGDRVDLGAGTRVVGDVHVGDEATVGANTFITEDVPAGRGVLGVPGRLLPKRGKRVAPVVDSIPSRPVVLGTTDQNPSGISLFPLLKEDLLTHGNDLISPGFWALAIHRFGNFRMGISSKVVRAPLSVAYNTAYQLVRTSTGIDLSYVVKVGRRVRIHRPGALMIGAVSVGDDVVFRNSATIGVIHRKATAEKPVIGSRVEVGPGACIVGAIAVGEGAVIGANTVVFSNVEANSIFLGVPGRKVTPRDYGRMDEPIERPDNSRRNA